MIEVTKRTTYDYICIYINGILHLAFKRRRLLGMQAWMVLHKYVIELTFGSDATIELEYEDEERWKKVINLLAEEYER